MICIVSSLSEGAINVTNCCYVAIVISELIAVVFFPVLRCIITSCIDMHVYADSSLFRGVVLKEEVGALLKEVGRGICRLFYRRGQVGLWCPR